MSPDEIAELRTRLGISQGAFAQLLGTSQPIVSNWEHGKNAPNRFYRALLQAIERNANSGVYSEDFLNRIRLGLAPHPTEDDPYA